MASIIPPPPEKKSLYPISHSFYFYFFPKPKKSLLDQKINLGHQVANFHPQKITFGPHTDKILISYYSNNKVYIKKKHKLVRHVLNMAWASLESLGQGNKGGEDKERREKN